jgi:hypothetical protein
VQSTVYTRRKKLVDHKGAATHVLDNMYIHRKSIGVTVREGRSTAPEDCATSTGQNHSKISYWHAA